MLNLCCGQPTFVQGVHELSGVAVVSLCFAVSCAAARFVPAVLICLFGREHTVLVSGRDEEAAWYVAQAEIGAALACWWVCAMGGLQVALWVLCGGDDTLLLASVSAMQAVMALFWGAMAAGEISM
jgi:hypothetical protein